MRFYLIFLQDLIKSISFNHFFQVLNNFVQKSEMCFLSLPTWHIITHDGSFIANRQSFIELSILWTLCIMDSLFCEHLPIVTEGFPWVQSFLLLIHLVTTITYGNAIQFRVVFVFLDVSDYQYLVWNNSVTSSQWFRAMSL